MILKNACQRWPQKLVLAALLLGPLAGNAQTDIVVAFQNATSQTFTVQPTGKLYFRGDTLAIAPDATTPISLFPLSIIRKIYFANGPAAVVNTSKLESGFTIAPNPVENQFVIQSAESKKMSVRLFNLAGKEVLRGSYLSGEAIAINHLAAGLYILTINDQPFKLLKK